MTFMIASKEALTASDAPGAYLHRLDIFGLDWLPGEVVPELHKESK